MKKFLSAAIIMVFISGVLLSQDTLSTGEKIKTGWSFGGVPAIAYDSDIGFKYGAVVEFFNYGDGTTYPKYLHHLYFEWSRTTKGSGINQFTYDSEYLIPGIRVTAEASHLTEKALDFYGFNGYESFYNANFEDDESEDYLSRMFYRQERKLTRLKAEFQGKITGQQFRWVGGIEYNHAQTGTVDIEALNKGKDEEDLLPEDVDLLFDKYLQWGFIDGDEAKGGNTTLLKGGLVYDTRDIEANPMKGVWTDMQFLYGFGDMSYTRLAITHRQYFTVVPKVLSFAYRLSYQTKLGGEMPYYMLPFVYNTAPTLTRDGPGGAKTIRGVLRNRLAGEGFAYGNTEFRWKFLRTELFNQNIYLALSAFLDGGLVTRKYNLPATTDPEAIEYLSAGSSEKIHMGAGAGFHFVMNENFVVAIDYGRAFDPDDGESGLYIGLNFLY